MEDVLRDTIIVMGQIVFVYTLFLMMIAKIDA